MSSSPEAVLAVPAQMRVQVGEHRVQRLCQAWQAAATEPQRCVDAGGLGELDWQAATVPGTAAGAQSLAGRAVAGEAHDFDAQDWWFRTSFDAPPAREGEQVALCLDGIATVAEVYLNGERILSSASMFQGHALDVGDRLRGTNELAICCRALTPLLHQRRRPRARWRTRLVSEPNLRFFRTMLLGRAPGFAPGPAAVGPWREVRLERRRGLVVTDARLSPRVCAGDGRLGVRVRVRMLDGPPPSAIELELSGRTGRHACALALDGGEGDLEAHGELQVPGVALWWPHTHGEPALYEARLLLSGADGAGARAPRVIELGKVGFRTLSAGPGEHHDPERDGLDLHINGVRVFARGAIWTPIDLVGMAPSESQLHEALEQARQAGMNILRIPGTSAYESAAFYEKCDELGMLLWQDLMFANLDYPISEKPLRCAVERETRQVLEQLRGRPSVAVLCGNSEIEQQVGMLGLDPSIGRGELFGSMLPELVRESGIDAVYVPSAPCGGDQPFRPDRGVANYYGVGGYRRPLEDARRAGVRFAAECLAFANVPDESAIEQMMPQATANLVVHHPRWKAGVPRDAGSGWDFDDVRDHYLGLLFGVDPPELRRVDHERYLELSRAVTGEVMAEVFGEWRREASPCGGGIVLWLRDLMAGAGWGVIDHRGEPKVAYNHLRRALAPIAVWTTDEGLGGVVAHVANDRPAPLRACLRVSLYRDFEQLVDTACEIIELGPHGYAQRNVEALIGRFVDAAWAYRFGPPQQDVIVVSLEQAARETASEEHRGALISQAVRFPAGRPKDVESAARLGLRAAVRPGPDGTYRMSVRSARLAYGVRVHIPGYTPADDAFSVEPGGERSVTLRRRGREDVFAGGAISALNLRGTVSVQIDELAPGAARAEHDEAAPPRRPATMQDAPA